MISLFPRVSIIMPCVFKLVHCQLKATGSTSTRRSTGCETGLEFREKIIPQREHVKRPQECTTEKYIKMQISLNFIFGWTEA